MTLGSNRRIDRAFEIVADLSDEQWDEFIGIENQRRRSLDIEFDIDDEEIIPLWKKIKTLKRSFAVGITANGDVLFEVGYSPYEQAPYFIHTQNVKIKRASEIGKILLNTIPEAESFSVRKLIAEKAEDELKSLPEFQEHLKLLNELHTEIVNLAKQYDISSTDLLAIIEDRAHAFCW